MQIKKRRIITYCLFLLPLFSSAQLWQRQTQKFLQSPGFDLGSFGASVDLTPDGNTAIVGAKSMRVGDVSFQGVAYICTRAAGVWSIKQTLASNAPREFDFFGSSVSISADSRIAIVGATETNSFTSGGRAFVFVNNGTDWVQRAVLRNSDLALGDSFGEKISLSSDGSVAVIAAPKKRYGTAQTAGMGVCYVFTRENDSTWLQTQVLRQTDNKGDDAFGSSVAISGDGSTIAIGSAGYRAIPSQPAGSVGKAYVYKRQNNIWVLQTGLLGSDYKVGDFFGNSLSLSDDGKTLLVGAYFSTGSRGKAYFFEQINNSWVEKAIITSPDGTADFWFGNGVGLSRDGYTGVIGAINEGSRRGKGYVYARTRDGWVLQSALLANDAQSINNMGYSVGVSANGNTVLLGAPDNESSRGGVHVFVRTPNSTDNNLSVPKVKVYPSVVKESLTVECENTGQEFTVQMINATGQMVESQRTSGVAKIDTRKMPAGMYILTIWQNATLVAQQKVFVE